MSLLIKNGRVITATEDKTADILCEGETIKQIGSNQDEHAINKVDGDFLPSFHTKGPFRNSTSRRLRGAGRGGGTARSELSGLQKDGNLFDRHETGQDRDA